MNHLTHHHLYLHCSDLSSSVPTLLMLPYAVVTPQTDPLTHRHLYLLTHPSYLPSVQYLLVYHRHHRDHHPSQCSSSTDTPYMGYNHLHHHSPSMHSPLPDLTRYLVTDSSWGSHPDGLNYQVCNSLTSHPICMRTPYSLCVHHPRIDISLYQMYPQHLDSYHPGH